MHAIRSLAPASRSLATALVTPLLLALGACAGMRRPAAHELVAPAGPTTSRSSYVLSGPELGNQSTRSLLEVLDARWPGFVSGELPRGPSRSPAPIVGTDRFGVYDAHGALLGGPDVLAGVRPADVRQLRRLTAIEEASRFGHSHPAGAVVLSLYALTR